MTLLQIMEFIFLMGPFATRGDVARQNAEVIAEGAVRGFLTTQTPNEGFGNKWRLTALGVHELGLQNPPLRELR